VNKQEKGAYATALRSAARRAKIARVVYVLTDRNRGKQWKSICIEAAQLCGARFTAVAKMREAVYAFSLAQRLIASSSFREAPLVPADFDLDRYIKEGDETAALASGMTPEAAARGALLLHAVPGMRRGRPRRW